MESISHSPAARPVIAEKTQTGTVSASEAKGAPRPPIASELIAKLQEMLGAMPEGGGDDRKIDLTSISKNADGEIEIDLRSGGGFAGVTLTEDGAKFTLPTPAFLRDTPGMVTQNVVEYEIDFSDLSPKKHAQLIDDLQSALENEDVSGLSKKEVALRDDALAILDQPEVTRERAVASLREAISEVFDSVLADASPDQHKDCKDQCDVIRRVGTWSTVTLPSATFGTSPAA